MLPYYVFRPTLILTVAVPVETERMGEMGVLVSSLNRFQYISKHFLFMDPLTSLYGGSYNRLRAVLAE